MKLGTTLRDRWKSPALAALVVANAALGLSLFGDLLPGVAPAHAQAGRPSDYLMIPATLTTANQDILYILDTQNGNLTAAAFNPEGGITFIPPLVLSQALNNR